MADKLLNIMSQKLKVFHGLVNYGTQSGLLARGLRKKGIKAVSVTNQDKFQRITDIELKKSDNYILKFFQRFWHSFRKIKWFFQYNTFHFYFGNTLFRNQLDLPFYHIFGKKVVMEHLGNDIRNYKMLVERYSLGKSHRFYQNMEDHDHKVRKRIAYEDKYLDYRLVCLPSHLDLVNADDILPLALDLTQFIYTPKKVKDEVIIMHAPTERVFKGTKHVIDAIERLEFEGYAIKFNLVENVTHDRLKKEYIGCDIFIDQISTGWYGTAALEAMAIGRTTCAYIDERYFKYIDYQNEIPVINVNRNTLYDILKGLINKKNELGTIGRNSRNFVEKHHEASIVTEKLADIYYNKIWN